MVDRAHTVYIDRTTKATRYAQRIRDDRWFRQVRIGTRWGEWIACTAPDTTKLDMQTAGIVLPED